MKTEGVELNTLSPLEEGCSMRNGAKFNRSHLNDLKTRNIFMVQDKILITNKIYYVTQLLLFGQKVLIKIINKPKFELIIYNMVCIIFKENYISPEIY